MNEILPTIRPLAEASVIDAFGERMILHLGAEDTGGEFSMC